GYPLSVCTSRLGHQRYPHAHLPGASFVVAQQGFAVSLEILDVQVAIHVEEGALQGPGGFHLGGVAAVAAMTIQTGEHQAVVLGIAQPPVYVAGIVTIVGVLVLDTEIALDARCKRERAAVVETIIELGLYIAIVQGAGVFIVFAVGLVLNTGGQSDKPVLLGRLPQGILAPEQAGLERGINEGIGVGMQIP